MTNPLNKGNNIGAEQSLEPDETCCLAEIFLPRVESREELLDICELLYRINKHSLTLPSHQPTTEEVVHRNMRMGIGITGFMQASEEQINWLSEAYEYLREFDREYSERKGMNTSIKLTTVKPSGTLSLLPGVTPGCHPGYAQYMIRRIRISSDNPLVNVCKSHGYPTEFQRSFDGKDDYGTVVVTFPFKFPEGTRLAKDMTAIDQLEVIKRLQTIWSDNSVSCTVYYRPEELEDIKAYLKENYRDSHKSLSFLLHAEHGFDQAPYEEITEEEYNELKSKTRLIRSIDSADFDGIEECESGHCPIR